MEQPIEKYYTYADLISYGEDVRVEIINGELYMMSSPTPEHQQISGEIYRQIANYLTDKPCQVYAAPLDVRLFENENDNANNVDTVVIPDISVICDVSKIDKHGCKGAPDMIIEILSPSTARIDRLIKLNLYQRAKVREYWIVNPQDQTVETYLLDENAYLIPTELYTSKDIAKITVLNKCQIELDKVFTVTK